MPTASSKNIGKSYDLLHNACADICNRGHGSSKKTLYRNAYECGNALPEAYKPYEDMDSMGQCIETDRVSSSTLMPKLRPSNLGK